MPVIKTSQKTTTVVLPSTKELPEDEQIKVTLLHDVSANGMVEIEESDGSNKGARIIALYVADWNVTDEAGEKIAITAENLGLLAYSDFKFLDRYVGEVINKSVEAVDSSLKELLSGTSQPSTTDNLQV